MVPQLVTFLEIKSRTWSRNDAENKSKLALELIKFLNLQTEPTITKDYIDLL